MGLADGDARLAFENVERRRAEFAFAADDFAAPEMALHHGALVEREKSAGDVFEDRQRLQLIGRDAFRTPAARRSARRDDALVG